LARFTYRTCKCCRNLHEVSAWPTECEGHFGPAVRVGPQIISDTIEPFQSMASGAVFSSKSRYRADLRARGMIEVGNERVQHRATPLPRAGDDIRRALHQLGS
jgi:hypothetical protein